MARVSPEEVAEIIEVDAAIPLTPFILLANLMVTEHVAAADSPPSTAMLKEIERWLSAHFYAIRDPRITSESAKGVSASYQMEAGAGLRGTPYGMQAVSLDSSGVLAGLSDAKGTGTVESISVTP